MQYPKLGTWLGVAALLTTTAQAQVPVVRATPAPQQPQADSTYGLPGAVSERVLRARANLQALLDGRLSTADLSAQELQDVIDLERLVRGEHLIDNRTPQQQCIDEEVRRIIEDAHVRCRQVMSAHVDKLHELAAALIEEETIEGDVLTRLLGPAENRIMPEDDVPADASPPPPPTPAGGGDTDEERPQGRPGLAWGQQSSAVPPAE